MAKCEQIVTHCDQPKTQNVIIFDSGGNQNPLWNGGAEEGGEDLPAPTRSKFQCDQGDADHGPQHAEPLDQVVQPVSPVETMNVSYGVFRPRLQPKLPDVVRCVECNGAVMQPAHDSGHVIAHRIRVVRWIQERSYSNQRDDQGG